MNGPFRGIYTATLFSHPFPAPFYFLGYGTVLGCIGFSFEPRVLTILVAYYHHPVYKVRCR